MSASGLEKQDVTQKAPRCLDDEIAGAPAPPTESEVAAVAMCGVIWGRDIGGCDERKEAQSVISFISASFGLYPSSSTSSSSSLLSTSSSSYNSQQRSFDDSNSTTLGHGGEGVENEDIINSDMQIQTSHVLSKDHDDPSNRKRPRAR